MASSTHSACRAARNDIFLRRHEESEPDGSTKSFFPLDRLRQYLSKEKVKEILECSCQVCKEDCKSIGNHRQPLDSLPRINGEESGTKDTSKTAYSLFSLLIYVEHPILIIGFLDHDGVNDLALELYPDSFKEAELKRYTRSYASIDNVGFSQFAFQFATYKAQFAVRHMDSGHFSRYPPGTILPFIREIEIGKQLDEAGHLTNIGANGRVFSFEIYDEYRKFPHAKKLKAFARKRVETTPFTEHLERANLQNVQSFNDKHIVKLIKAYSLGGVMNLVFPLARTNLDHLLRNPRWDYASARGGQLGSCDAWKQVLGIAKALSRISGVPSNAVPSASSREPYVAHWVGFHFDLKPANILISDDGTWLITDFGQATFTFSSDRTPRVANQGGTDAYAPPEIDNLDERFSRRYDVWSLGCIILEVTAFVVLGYDGLKGSSRYSGLDQIRHSSDGWSRRTDDRFFYRAERQGKPEVKPNIIDFMAFLKEEVGKLDQSSQQFLASILQLIEGMLQPVVETRIEIGEVIRILGSTITQASSLDEGGQPLNTVAAPGELDIGSPELGLVKIWHWNRSFEIWQNSSLRVFEDPSGNLRFYSLADNRAPTETYPGHRPQVEIIPYYAFWDNEKPQANEKWLSFAHIDPAGGFEMPQTVYAFSHLPDARFVQSKITYQNIETSFPLRSVKVKRYRKPGRKLFNAVASAFRSKNAAASRFEDNLDEEKDLGPATIQLWTEQVDQVASRGQEKQSITSGDAKVKRKPRVLFQQQPGYRNIHPRRAVIYLHRYGSIVTLKMDVNWIAREIDRHVMHFLPNKPDRDPHFVSSLIHPSHGDIAGVPLCPQILRYVESESRFEADRFILQFAADDAPAEFNKKYRTMKQAWEKEKDEVEKLQGFTPVHLAPDPYPEGLSSVSKGKQKAYAPLSHERTVPAPRDVAITHNNIHSSSIGEYYGPFSKAEDKGKDRIFESRTLHTRESSDGYMIPQPQPQPRPQRQPQVSSNGSLAPQPSSSLPSRTTTKAEIQSKSQAHHRGRGGSRGAPPKSWSKNPYKGKDGASAEK